MPIVLHKPHEPRMGEFAKGRNFGQMPFALRKGPAGHTMFLGDVDGGMESLGAHASGGQRFLMRIRHDRFGSEIHVFGKGLSPETQLELKEAIGNHFERTGSKRPFEVYFKEREV